jgi:hypothetical protein
MVMLVAVTPGAVAPPLPELEPPPAVVVLELELLLQAAAKSPVASTTVTMPIRLRPT